MDFSIDTSADIPIDVGDDEPMGAAPRQPRAPRIDTSGDFAIDVGDDEALGPVERPSRATIEPGTAKTRDEVPVISRYSNVERGVVERAGTIAGGLVSAANTGLDVVDEYTGAVTAINTGFDRLEEAIPLGSVTISEDGIEHSNDASKGRQPLEQLQSGLQNLNHGYTPGTTWEQVKENPNVSNIASFAVEQGVVSLPDMVAAITALPAYIVARTGEISDNRAEADQRTNATAGDLLAALPTAVAASLLERLGGSKMLGLDEIAATGIKQGVKSVAKAGATEAGTEFAQEVLEDFGTTAGTRTGFDAGRALDAGLAGAVAGGPFGAGVRAVTASGEIVGEKIAPTEINELTSDPAAQVIGEEPVADIAETPVIADPQPERAEPTGFAGEIPSNIADIITTAAQTHGVEPATMVAIAMIESGGDPNAQNPNSSAGGLFQAIDSTAAEYGLENRFDPVQAADFGARFLKANAATLRQGLGREPTPGELYLAHQQGATGALRILSNPNALAAELVGADAVALNGGTANMTAAEFAGIWTSKLDGGTRIVRGDPRQFPSNTPRPSLQEMLDDDRPAEQIADDIRATDSFEPTSEWQYPPEGYDTAGLDVRTDGVGRTVVRRPATPGTRENPVDIKSPEDVSVAAPTTEQPTSAQAEAGNYRKRHVKFHGMPISIETEQGQERTGLDSDGNPWSVVMPAPYGYIKRTEGADGDHVDGYLGGDSSRVFVVDQKDPDTLEFDEHKVMLGYENEQDAMTVYEQGFSDGSGQYRAGAVTEMSVAQFRQWVRNGKKTKPMAYKKPRVRGRGGARKGPMDLLTFIGSQGGIRDEGGELAAMGLAGHLVPGFGPLARSKGLDLDRMRELAQEAGYIAPTGAGTTWVSDLLDAIDASAQGNPVFTQADMAEQMDRETEARAKEEQAREAELRTEIEAIVKQGKGRLLDGEMDQVLSLVAEGYYIEDAIVTVFESNVAELDAEQQDQTDEAGELPIYATAANGEGQGIAPSGEPERQSEPSQGIETGSDEPVGGQYDPGEKGEAGSERVVEIEPVSEPQPEPPQNNPEPTPPVEPGADGVDQSVIPGAEQITDKELAERRASGKKKPKVEQNDPDGLFGDDAQSPELFDAPAAPAKPPAEPATEIQDQSSEGDAEPAPAQDKPKPKATAKDKPVEDFGEKLEGARKDAARKLVDSLVEPVDISIEPLSKAFPQPDYVKLAEEGIDARALAYVALIRQAIPSKPRRGYKVASWAKVVSEYRSIARDLISGEMSAASLQAKINSDKMSSRMRNMVMTADVIRSLPPEMLPFAAKFNVEEMNRNVAPRGQEYDFQPTLVLLHDGRITKIEATTIDELIEPARAEIIRRREGMTKEGGKKRRTKLSTYRDRTTKDIFIGFKGLSGDIRLKTGFEDGKAARGYIEENADALQAEIDQMRAGPNMRRAENMRRTGKERRDSDVTPQSFTEAFGFRGVQFGNYVVGGRRQKDLNEAFDALMDLADVLGIPSRALSLDGSLGLAFGARGTGGKNAAAAHYEPGSVVINLTKNSGPGSLAHEWLHAVDNYFGKRGTGQTYVSEAGKTDPDQMRPKIFEAWKTVEKSIKKGGFATRANELDKARSKPYWGTTREKVARSFERYVVDRLSESDASNDYLANIDATGGAYPTEQEMMADGIRQAYDNLFDVMDSRETEDGNIGLFALRNAAPRSAAMSKETVGEPLSVFQNTQPLKRHADYTAAKAGDPDAALRLVDDLIEPERFEEALERFGSGAIYAAIHAEEASGRNQIPQALSEVFVARADGVADRDIVQINRAYHTGAKAAERLIARPLFAGPVVEGGRYVIVDDVTVMGSTIAEMAHHIGQGGGEVVGVVLFVNASRMGEFLPSQRIITDVKRRFGDAITNEIGIEPEALTAAEAQYLRNFRNAQFLRDRIASARQERNRRLHGKGIGGEGEESLALRQRQPKTETFGDSLTVETTSAERTDAVEALERDMRKILDDMGLGDVALRLAETIRLYSQGKVGEADGRYFQGLIDVALDGDDPMSVLHHEAFHALVDHGFFTEEELKILHAKSRSTWMKRHDIEVGYKRFPERAKLEEGITHAFQDWVAGRKNEDGLIARAFRKLKNFLERLSNALQGQGFQTAEDIFAAVASGEVGERAGRPSHRDRLFKSDFDGKADGEQKFALRSEPVTAEENQQVMQGFLARGQPIDRAIRMPFNVFGGIDATGQWKPAKYLYARNPYGMTGAMLGARLGAGITNPIGQAAGYAAGRLIAGRPGSLVGEALATTAGGLPGAAAGGAVGYAAGTMLGTKFNPDGRFRFMNNILEPIRRGLIDRYGLDPEYEKTERRRELNKRATLAEGKEFLDSLARKGVGTSEAKVLQAMLNGEAISSDAWADLAQPIREAVDQMGQEAVALGLVSPESYRRFRGTYMHRSYMKHEGDQSTLSKFADKMMSAHRKRIAGDSMKGRGIFLDISPSRLTRDDPEWHSGIRGKVENGEKFIILDRMSGQDDMIDADTPQKVVQRVYLPADRPVPAKYEGWKSKGTWEVRPVRKGGDYTLWRDYTKEERTNMGEILDARYNIAKTYLIMSNDLATGRFYKDISENEAWAVKAEPAEEWRETSDYSRFWSDDSVIWVKVPNTGIPKTGGKKRYGALSGMYVKAEIWRDLKETEVASNPGSWRKIMTFWKLNKTARNPVVHMNNVMSNMIFMDLADIRLQDLYRGLRSYRSGDRHYQEALENGAFGSDMMSKEIRDNVLKPILAEIELNMARASGPQTVSTIMRLSEIFAKVRHRLDAIDQKMIDMYRVEDEVFRMATYMRRIEFGDSPEEAADFAREQFLDYNIRAPWVVMARNSALPFIAYNYRAAPLVAKAIAVHPWKMAKYFAIFYAANALAYAFDEEDDEEKERAVLRKEEQGYSWAGIPRMMRMPWRDDHGLPVFLDIRRWIPAGDIFDMKQGNSAIPIPPPLIPGGPLVIGGEILFNTQLFNGKPITKATTDDWRDYTDKMADYLWKSWMPSAPWVPNSWYWEKISLAAHGAEDAQHRVYSIPQAFMSSAGIKIRPHDVAVQMEYRRREFARVERDLKFDMGDLYKKFGRGHIKQGPFEARRKRILEKVERNARAFQELVNRVGPKESRPRK